MRQPTQALPAEVRLAHGIVSQYFPSCNRSGKIYTGSIAIPPKPRIFLSAGEASGDHYGAQLITELRRRLSQLACFGLGGREMEDAGLDRVVRAEDVAHMGITEVLRHMPRVYRDYRSLVAADRQRRRDDTLLIHFPHR